MGFFKGLLQTGKSLGRNIGGAFGDAANRTGTGAKIALQISALEMEQGKLEREYDNLCTAVGKNILNILWLYISRRKENWIRHCAEA